MRTLVAFLLPALLAAAAPAAAGSLLSTPPLRADTADVDCMVLHLGSEDGSAIGRLKNGLGAVVDGGSPYPIYPGLNNPASATNATGYFYCEFEGLAKGMRGYISLEEGDQTVLMLPASR